MGTKSPLVRDVLDYVMHLGVYARALAKWLVISAIVGLGCGVLGSAFHVGVEAASSLREGHPAVLFALPVAGLTIAGIYRLLGVEGLGTDAVLDQIQTGDGLTPRILPAVFASTIITHLVGGSAGREGAALQMGGSVGLMVGRVLHVDERDLRIATMAGMAAFFSALFGTPIAATVFALGVISVGVIYHVAFVPCLSASLVAYEISLLMGVEPTRFALIVPAITPVMVVQVAVLAALCGLLAGIFCEVLHHTERVVSTYIPNDFLRGVIGGMIILAITLALGTQDYNGTGMAVITRAVEAGQAHPAAFVLKMVLTAITLSCGFKGGEVVPCFFIGASFGCVAAPVLGLSAQLGAALGLVAVFCGAVNCPVASVILGVELFGAEGLILFAVSCGLAYMLSGYSGLYFSQRILYDKLKASFIDVRANAYHEGGYSRRRL